MTEDGEKAARFDLDAYLKRIEYGGELRPSTSVLEALHVAHATHIPFENLDILLGRPILIDIASVQEKLVTLRRGGYCFEQNLLFCTALEALGFFVTQLGARVRLGSDMRRARTHMTLLVDVDETGWLADVGFGASGSLYPVPFGDGREVRHGPWAYRIIAADGEWVLQSRVDGPWSDQYTFTLEAQHQVDYVVSNHYTSTYPGSPFTQILTAQQILPDVRRTLRNRDYSEDRGTVVTRRTLADDDEILALLAEKFGLRFPPGTRFRYSATTL